MDGTDNGTDVAQTTDTEGDGGSERGWQDVSRLLPVDNEWWSGVGGEVARRGVVGGETRLGCGDAEA